MSSRFSDLARPGLDTLALRARLCAPAGPAGRLEVVAETGSTNTDLARLAATEQREWPDLSILAAEHQTAARGRMDRSWSAPARSGLAVSFLLRPVNPKGRPLPTQTYSWLPLLAGLALVTTLRARAEVDAELKWPNDVQVNGLKVAGILSQLGSSVEGAPPPVVIGTGLNVSLTEEELPVATATSLGLQGADTNRSILLSAYVRSFAAVYARFCAADGDPDAPRPADAIAVDGYSERVNGHPPNADESLRQQCAAVMVTLGQRVRAELPGGARLVGTAARIGDGGALVLVDAAGTEKLVAAGDIVHLRPIADG